MPPYPMAKLISRRERPGSSVGDALSVAAAAEDARNAARPTSMDLCAREGTGTARLGRAGGRFFDHEGALVDRTEVEVSGRSDRTGPLSTDGFELSGDRGRRQRLLREHGEHPLGTGSIVEHDATGHFPATRVLDAT